MTVRVGASPRLEVIAEVLEDHRFVLLLVVPGEFDEGLQQMEEKGFFRALESR